MCPRTGRSLKARAWRHGSGFSSRLHVGYISDTIFIGLAKGLVWRTEEGVFCVRQMQGGKREEACLERRRLDNAVESDVEGDRRYIAIHTIPIQSPLKANVLRTGAHRTTAAACCQKHPSANSIHYRCMWDYEKAYSQKNKNCQ